MVLVRNGVGNVNEVVIKLPMVMGSMLGPFNPLNLHSELPYLILKSNHGIVPPYFMSLFKGEAPKIENILLY